MATARETSDWNKSLMTPIRRGGSPGQFANAGLTSSPARASVDFGEYMKQEGRNLSGIEEGWTEEGVKAAVERIRGFYPPLAEDIDRVLVYPGFNFLADDVKAKVFEYMNRRDEDCAKIEFGPELLKAFTHLYQISKDIGDEIACHFEQGTNYNDLPDDCKSMLMGQIGYDSFYDSFDEPSFAMYSPSEPSLEPSVPEFVFTARHIRALDLLKEENPVMGDFIDILLDKGIEPPDLPEGLREEFDAYLLRVPESSDDDDDEGTSAEEEFVFEPSAAGAAAAAAYVPEERDAMGHLTDLEREALEILRQYRPLMAKACEKHFRSGFPARTLPNYLKLKFQAALYEADLGQYMGPSGPATGPSWTRTLNIPEGLLTNLEERALDILFNERPMDAKTVYYSLFHGYTTARLPKPVQGPFRDALERAALAEGIDPATLGGVKKVKSITIMNKLRFWKKKKKKKKR